MPPERAPKPGTSSGLLVIEQLPAGSYHITIPGEAWIDVVQGRRRVPSVDFSGVKGCPGLRKSVLFALGVGKATIQISGAASGEIVVAIAPVEPP